MNNPNQKQQSQHNLNQNKKTEQSSVKANTQQVNQQKQSTSSQGNNPAHRSAPSSRKS